MEEFKEDHPSIVYVMATDENGPCKIGKSSNVFMRHQTLQLCHWMPLALFGARMCLDRKNLSSVTFHADLSRSAYAVEAATHRALMSCDLHLRGEWFDVSAREALQAIEAAAKQLSISAIGLDAVLSVEMPEYESALVKKTHQQLARVLTRINAFSRETIDNLEDCA